MLPEDLQSRRSSSPTQRRPCPAFPGFEKVTIIYSTTRRQTSASPLSSLSLVCRELCTDSTPGLPSSLASLSAHLHSSSDTTTSHPEQGKEAPAFPGCGSPHPLPPSQDCYSFLCCRLSRGVVPYRNVTSGRRPGRRS